MIELKKYNILPPDDFRWNARGYSMDKINIDQLDHNSSVYFQGGEPTIMPEVRQFLRDCIDKGKTNFLFSINSSGILWAGTFCNQKAPRHRDRTFRPYPYPFPGMTR